jgi:UDP-N-acetylmuramoyl-tripeptide--D-alanyl-D-alanine ligase
MLEKRLPKGRKIKRKKFNLYHWYNTVTFPSSDVEVGLYRYRASQCPIKVSETHLVGDYNQENIAAAFAVGMCWEWVSPHCREAICGYVPTNNRSQLLQTERNTVVVDAYNANPTSMTAAINAFTYHQSPITNHQSDCYILGAMRELGEYSRLEHQNIVNMLLERKADKVLLVGEEYKDTTAPYPVFDNVEALCENLKTNPLAGFRILLKGSRSNQLEKVIPFL